MNENALQRLVDCAEIRACVDRYCRGMDRHDRDLVRSAYHPGAVDDHAAFVGAVDDFIDWSFAYQDGHVRSQHYVTNHLAEIDGDQAHAETYYVYVGTPQTDGAPITMTGGRYIDRFERREGRWAIAARKLLVEWQTELPSSLDRPTVEFLTTVGTVARNRSDTSYDRPLVVRDPS